VSKWGINWVQAVAYSSSGFQVRLQGSLVRL